MPCYVKKANKNVEVTLGLLAAITKSDSRSPLFPLEVKALLEKRKKYSGLIVKQMVNKRDLQSRLAVLNGDESATDLQSKLVACEQAEDQLRIIAYEIDKALLMAREKDPRQVPYEVIEDIQKKMAVLDAAQPPDKPSNRGMCCLF